MRKITVFIMMMGYLPLLASFSFTSWPSALFLPSPRVFLDRALSSNRSIRMKEVLGESMNEALGESTSWILQGGESSRALGAPLKSAPGTGRRVNGADSKRNLNPRPILDLACVEEFLAKRGKKEVHARTLYKWLFRRNKRGSKPAPALQWTSESLPSDLGRELREELVREFALTTSTVVTRTESESGGFKLGIQLQDGHLVETVVIRHEHLSSNSVRHTVCVSSQVGCAKACTFCATGTMGFRADLSAGEIAEQIWHAQRALEELSAPDNSEEVSIRNVVFMVHTIYTIHTIHTIPSNPF